MALDDVLRDATALERALDAVIEGARGDLRRQRDADWTWYRFLTVNVLVRERGAGPVAASLARGLLEQAAYWDFSLANGSGEVTMAAWAAAEYEGLRRLAHDVDDDTWLGWLLPPGEALASAGGVIPRNAGDAVQRIGSGFAATLLEPLRYGGLLAANRILDVLTHGNLAAALVMAPGGGDELPEPLAAAVVHVAAAAAVATVTAQLGTHDITTRGLVDLATRVATTASALHGLRSQRVVAPKSPAKPTSTPAVAVASEIDQMPEAPAAVAAVAERFVDAARAVRALAASRIDVRSAGGAAAWASFQMSWGELMVLLGAVQGTLGRALVPFAARALLEDGARWEWLRLNATRAPTGDSMRAIVSESKRHIGRVRDTMVSAGADRRAVDDLIAAAGNLLESDPGDLKVPPTGELLAVAYANPSGVESARVMYSVLSQFVHATPLSVLHLRRDVYHSVTAPIYAIGVESACRGFFNIARTTLTIACDWDTELEDALVHLAGVAGEVRVVAARWHCLG